MLSWGAILLAASGIVLQALFIRSDSEGDYLKAAALKAAASAVFVALGIAGALAGPAGPCSWLVCLGLLFGMAGDILHGLRFVRGRGLRSEKRSKLVREHLFTIGALFFLAGHICYLGYLLPKEKHLFAVFVAAAALSAALIWRLSRTIRMRGPRAAAGAAYLACISLLACAAAGLWAETGALPDGCFAFGAALFLISDTLLVLNSFGPKRSPVRRIWSLSTYYAAQLLIASGLML